MAERTCLGCQRSPRETGFRKEKRSRDGLSARCKGCLNAKQNDRYRDMGLAERSALLSGNMARYEENRERYLAAQKQYRTENLDAVRARDRARSAGDPRKIARSKAWREANPDRFRESLRRWYSENRDTYPFSSDPRQRIEYYGTNAPVEDIKRRDVWLAHEGLCGICGSGVLFREMHLDHVIPLSKGGGHVWENVQPAHEFCNLSKKNREGRQWRPLSNWPPRPSLLASGS